MANDQTKEIQTLLQERLDAAVEGDYFSVLGLDDKASPKKVQDAYFKLAKVMHPDKISAYQDLSAEEKKGAVQIFKFATEAKDVLSDKNRRAQYVNGELQANRVVGGAGSAGKAKNRDELAKIAFHKGTVMLNKRAYAEAERYLKEACAEKPELAKHWQKLGWAVFQNGADRTDKQRLEEARRCWEKALKADDEDAYTHYYMSQYHKQSGNTSQCRAALEQALFLNANLVEAKRELRLLRMRSGKGRRSKTSGGFFGKLMEQLTKKR